MNIIAYQWLLKLLTHSTRICVADAHLADVYKDFHNLMQEAYHHERTAETQKHEVKIIVNNYLHQSHIYRYTTHKDSFVSEFKHSVDSKEKFALLSLSKRGLSSYTDYIQGRPDFEPFNYFFENIRQVIGEGDKQSTIDIADLNTLRRDGKKSKYVLIHGGDPKAEYPNCSTRCPVGKYVVSNLDDKDSPHFPLGEETLGVIFTPAISCGTSIEGWTPTKIYCILEPGSCTYKEAMQMIER
jgi:hypothetical protein